jgi:hypothetical protein
VLIALNGERVGRPADVARLAREARRNWAIDLIREGRQIRLRFRL